MINRELPSPWKRHIAWRAIWPVAAFAIFVWVLMVSIGLGLEGPRADSGRSVCLLVAIIVTLVCAVKAAAQWQRGFWLARHGAIVEAHPLPCPPYDRGPRWRPLRYKFEFRGKTYEDQWIPSNLARHQYQAGAKKIIVVVDPGDPTILLMYWDIFPDDAQSTIRAAVRESNLEDNE